MVNKFFSAQKLMKNKSFEAQNAYEKIAERKRSALQIPRIKSVGDMGVQGGGATLKLELQ